MDKFRISFTGDILVYECQNKICKIGPDKYDYTEYLKEAKPLFKDSSYVVGSLETPIAGKKAGYTKEDTNFNTPDGILNSLKMIGIDMLTTGNNHALDRGKNGLKRTLKILEDYGFDHTGTASTRSEKPYFIKTLHGVRVAFLSYTYGTNSSENECILAPGEEYMVNLTRRQDPIPQRSITKSILRSLFLKFPRIIRNVLRPEPKPTIISDCVSEGEINAEYNRPYVEAMLKSIAEAKKQSDLVIFCLHSGGQFNSSITGYTRWLINLIVAADVDAVVTNHTHTPLPIEQMQNGCIVAYSLGNFSFTPGIGYYVDGVNAEYSKVLHIEVDVLQKKITGFSTQQTKSIRKNNGSAKVVIL